MRTESSKNNIVSYIPLSSKQAIIFYGVILFLFYQIFDGPIRYTLNMLGIEIMLYIKDAILIAVLGVIIATAMLNARLNAFLLLTFAVLFFFTIIGFIYIPSVFQVLFSLKTLLPFIAGMAWYNVAVAHLDLTYKYFKIILLVATIGVFVNMTIDFPWQGLVYEIGGVNIKGGFDLTISGFSRLTGFARTNFEAATQILLFGVFVVCLVNSRFARLLIWLAAGAAIVITTTKGIIAAYAVLSLLVLFYVLFGNRYRILQKLLIIPICLMIGLPLFMEKIDIDYSDSIQVGLLGSFNDRLINGWPPIFQNVIEHGNPIFGLGVGGTGAGEYYFANVSHGSADNLFVFLYAWFGVFSLFFFVWIYMRNLKLDINKKKIDLFFYLFLLGTMLYGCTSVIIESPIFALFLGMAIQHLALLKSVTIKVDTPRKAIQIWKRA